MQKFFAVSQVGRRFGVAPDLISNGFYRNWLDPARCPIVGTRRVIPEDYLDELKAILIRRGYLDEAGQPVRKQAAMKVMATAG
jgi:hypothetical protein